jgi:outer membrane protein OmpA-like peptidoglycan-associated protein
MSDAAAVPAADPEFRRAIALLKLQQKMQQQGNTDLVKVVALGRKINSLPAGTLTQARTLQPSGSATQPRSIFKAKTASTGGVLPQVAGSQSVVEPVVPQPATQQAAVAAGRTVGAGGSALGASSDRIQIPASNGRITLNPTAALVFGSHEEVLEYSSAGTLSFQALILGPTQQGEVVFHVPVSWKFPSTGNRPADVPLSGTALAHVRVPFSIGPDKDKPDQLAITWQTARTVAMNSAGGGATLTGAPVTTDPTPNGGAATITPTVQFQEQLAHAKTHGSVTMSHATTATFSAGFLGTGGSVGQTEQVTHDLSAGSQDQTQVSVADSFSMSFTANLVLPKPEEVQTTAKLEVLFAVNSDSTAGGEEEKITQWYQGLDKKIRASIESGKTRIALLGKASATGSFDHNRKLAERRVSHVKDILSDLAGSDAKIHTQAVGRSQPHHPGEDPEERVVLVTLGEDRPAAVVADEAAPAKPPDNEPGY